MDPFTILDNIEKHCKDSVMNAFNCSIRQLRSLLRSGTYALDSSIIVTKPGFPGCGKTKRKKEGQAMTFPNTNISMASNYSSYTKLNHE